MEATNCQDKKDYKITTMQSAYTILAPTRYPWQFNGPRHSKHHIENRNFIPFNKISNKIEGITIFNPLPLRHFDLIHAFNRIPIGKAPFIIGFESHLPRAFGMNKTMLTDFMCRTLASPRCRKIVAISNYASNQFINQHKGNEYFSELNKKLLIRYPNVILPPRNNNFHGWENTPLKLVFVGNHFARKGGAVVARLADMANKDSFPLQIDIISTMETGISSWVDPLRPNYFEPMLSLLNSLPNIRLHGPLPNKKVMELISSSNFVLLPTLSDSFGYSAIEAMANSIPVIATDQGALPEFINDGINGILLSLDLDAQREWIHIARHDRKTSAYEQIFSETTEKLAQEAYQKIRNIHDLPSSYITMRENARYTAEKLFCSLEASEFWDKLYQE